MEHSKQTFSIAIQSMGAAALRKQIQAKLADFVGSDSEDVLAEYVVVLVGHGKKYSQTLEDLDAFLGDRAQPFVDWLWDHLTANIHLYSSKDVRDEPKKDAESIVAMDMESEEAVEKLEIMDDDNGQNRAQLQRSSSTKVKGDQFPASKESREREIPSSRSRGEFPSSRPHKDAERGRIHQEKEEATTERLRVRERREEPRLSHNDRFYRPPRERLESRKEGRREEYVQLGVRERRGAPWQFEGREARAEQEEPKPRRLGSKVIEVKAEGMEEDEELRGFKRRWSDVAMASAEEDQEEAEETIQIRPRVRMNPSTRLLQNAMRDLLGNTASASASASASAAEGASLPVKKKLKPVPVADPALVAAQKKLGEPKAEAMEGAFNARTGVIESKIPSSVWDRLGNSNPTDSKRRTGRRRRDGAANEAQNPNPKGFQQRGGAHGRLAGSRNLPDAGGPPRVELRKKKSAVLPLRESLLVTTEGGRMEESGGESDGSEGFGIELPPAPSNLDRRLGPRSGSFHQFLDLEGEEGEEWEEGDEDDLEVRSEDGYGESRSRQVALRGVSTWRRIPVLDRISAGNLDGKSVGSFGGNGTEEETGEPLDNVEVMKRRIRHVQLEMVKLKARQAEVTKDIQKSFVSQEADAAMAPSQEEIDARSIFVSNLHFAADTSSLKDHFKKCGAIVRATILMDKASGMPRGCGYVEFAEAESAINATELSGVSFLSRPLKVAPKSAAKEILPILQRAANRGRGRYGVNGSRGRVHGTVQKKSLQWKRPDAANSTETLISNVPMDVASNGILPNEQPQSAAQVVTQASNGARSFTWTASTIAQPSNPVTSTI